MCVCSRCEKSKQHFGLGMCSACLRRTKRETIPKFYLGTCYSEISRRTGIGDPRRPDYKGKMKCSKEEFINRFIEDDKFLTQYRLWQENSFKRGFAPSIDRIDNDGGYTLDNLQFLSNIENAVKESRIPVIAYRDEPFELLEFISVTYCAQYFNTTTGKICAKIKRNKKDRKGWIFKYA